MTIHVYTSFSFSYLNRARVLAASVKRHHPEWKFWALITDLEPAGFSLAIEDEDFDFVLMATDLYGDETERWLFAHDVIEACTAVKGRALLHLLDQPDCTGAMYFDPDTCIFNRLDDVVGLIEKHSVVLTPHQVDPEEKSEKRAIRDNEITSLGFGVYNLGFVAVGVGEESRRFAQWWADRLDDWCYDRLDIGIFVDQKWCDLVPSFFEDVKILRDPGYNVASWNLSQRTMSFDENGMALINGKPLRFYHFTKLGPLGDMMTQRYARDNTEVYELWWWYRQQIECATDDRIPNRYWHYGHFDNGSPIPKPVRELYRDRQDLRKAFRNPSRTADGFFDWLVSEGLVSPTEVAAAS